MYRYLTFIILIGGKSTRMGKEKFSIKIKKISFLDNMINFLFETGILKILISGIKFGYSFTKDIFEDIGPTIFLKTIENINKKTYNYFSISIDMQFINKKIIFFMILNLNKKSIYHNNEIFPVIIKKTKNTKFLSKIKFLYKNLSMLRFSYFTIKKFIKYNFIYKKNFLNINTFLEKNINKNKLL